MSTTKVLLSLVAALSVCAPATAQTSVIARITTDYKLSPLEAAAAVVIADALDIEMDVLISTRKSKDESFVVLGPALVLSHRTGRGLDEVLRHKTKGEGWGNVAKKLGMHPGEFNKLRVQGQSFESGCWMNMLTTKYKFPQKDYVRARNDGMTDIEIVLAVVRANGSTKTFDKELAKVKSERPSKPLNSKGGKGNGKGG